MAIQASEVLAHGGIGALKKWLSANKNAIKDRDLYIIGPDGADILGRRLTEAAARRLEYFNRDESANRDDFGNRDAPPIRESPADREAPAIRDPSGDRDAGIFGSRPFRPPPGNFRPSRAAPQIVSADGTAYTVLLVPRRPSIFGALSLPGISLAILCIALAVSALTSWWLAQHLSAPIRRIQEGARALSAESLDVRGGAGLRVSAGLEGRKDELAVLARDFDAMADQLRANRSAITQLLRVHNLARRGSPQAIF